ncbi:nidogen isoform X2 [Bacillus rossius redtenbacheri]|uniref:nidogen isoform X2 n=1 Tax=Bacillus rossius redtenbacheri TaxID=93214 RepID=UPI002FDDD0B5
MAALVLLLLAAACQAIPREELYPYGQSLDASLPRELDDCASPEITLRVPIHFYGEVYHSVYVNSNGLLSFLTDIPSFFNIQFPLDYPVIAPLYTNVDTRNSGSVYYRETQDLVLLSKATATVRQYFSKAANFTAKSLFIATWEDVGYHDGGSDKVNTFQAVVASSEQDSCVQLLYPEGGVQWIQGSGSASGLPDARAQAGLVAADGRLYTLRGSGTDQIHNLDKWSNQGVPGLWLFRVGRPGPDGNVEVPDQNISGAEVEQVRTCVHGATVCHSKSRCVDHATGFCCSCKSGYYGNGLTCLKDGIPLRVNGKVSGKVNGEEFSQLDLQSYVVTLDGRTYTAISRVPSSIGYDMQTLNIFGVVIGWLFARPVGKVWNGYDITGGMFNQTATVTFPLTGNKVELRQRYLGLDVFDQLKMEAEVQGDIPAFPAGVKIQIPDFEEHYTRTEPGLLLSKASLLYHLEGNPVDNPYSIEQTIQYTECPHSPLNMSSFRLKVARSFISYESRESIIRYGMTNKVMPPGDFDPCKQAQAVCGAHSSCRVEGDSFQCVCNSGYQSLFTESDGQQLQVCVDVNECSTGTHVCDKHAECINVEGGHSCRCSPGYYGDGHTCRGVDPCSELRCHVDAECVQDRSGSPVCRCLPGYTGDGFQCAPEDPGEELCSGLQCHADAECVQDRSGSPVCRCLPGYTGDGFQCAPEDPGEELCSGLRCHADAECVQDRSGSPVCRCLPGYTGDGFQCAPEDPGEELCSGLQCHADAECVQDHSGSPVCRCLPGYTGDGFQCTAEDPRDSCDVRDDCSPYGACTPDEEGATYSCVCLPGFVGDGYNCVDSALYNDTDAPAPRCLVGVCWCPSGFDIRGQQCVRSNELSCNEIRNCHPYAQCVFNIKSDRYECQCNAGYEGDGYNCEEIDLSCQEVDICDIHASCVLDSASGRSMCQCDPGFQGDGMMCSTTGVDCEGDTDCDPHAQCMWVEGAAQRHCVCGPGFSGDGHSCSEDQVSCSVLENCGLGADCLYDERAGGYRCRCQQGWTGDGYTCAAVQSCYHDPGLCSRDATCVLRPTGVHSCVCNKGFTGDGAQCRGVPTYDSNFLLVSQGMAVVRVRLHPTGRETSRPISVVYFQIAIGLDIDCLGGRLYWSDIIGGSIKSANYDGSNFTNFMDTGGGSPEGVSVDWVSGNLYWTDSTKDTVEVVGLHSGLRKVLVSEGLVNPRGVAVHPYRGKVFWSDWNRESPKLEWANLDGSERAVFLQGPSVKLPNSLAIDHETDELCWADAGTHSIACVGIGQSVERIVVANCSYPFGLAISKSHYYWTDWTTGRIESVERQSGERKSVDEVTGRPAKLYGIVVVPEHCPEYSNMCQFNNGGCSSGQLCLPRGSRSRSCVCADGGNDIEGSGEAPICNDI